MKRTVSLLFVLLGMTAIAGAQIQPDPAHWAYGLKKLTPGIYEVHLQCTIDAGWHIYAQKQGEDFIGTRTKIRFTKTPGLSLVGATREIGKKDTWKNKDIGITNYEYAGKVDFVQKVKLDPGLKKIEGTITYQTCTHKMCLTEQTISFTVPVNE